MVFLNHLRNLFGGKTGKAKRLIQSESKHIKSFEVHIANHKIREDLCKKFNFGNVDKALQDSKSLLKVLNQIEGLTSSELIDIKDEKKADSEIIDDLDSLKTIRELEGFIGHIVDVKQKEKHIIEFFNEILKVLEAELRLIYSIKKKPTKESLLKLFELIYHHEDRLYKLFREESFSGSIEAHKYIMDIARAVLLQKKIKEEKETDEEIFAEEMAKGMGPVETKRKYRLLAESIFYELADIVGGPTSEHMYMEDGLDQMKQLISDETIMYKLIKKLRPKYDKFTIRSTVIAFRKAFTLHHLEEFYADFAKKYRYQ